MTPRVQGPCDSDTFDADRKDRPLRRKDMDNRIRPTRRDVIQSVPALGASVAAASYCAFGSGPARAQTAAPGPTVTESVYMGAPAELVTAPNGAITNAKVLKSFPNIAYMAPAVEEVAEGVWCIGGYSIANCTVIEADDGLIVFDTGDNEEEGGHFLEAIRQNISDKPIRVIMYSHSHYALGGGAMVDTPSDVMVIGHPSLNETVQSNIRGGGAPSIYGEIGPILTGRAVVQMNNLMPEEGPDARLGGVIPFGKPLAHLPATLTPEHGETMDVLGIEMRFLTEFMSDDDNLTVWIPEKGIVLNNFFWPGTPNLYTLRGGVYREPTSWRDGLAMMRDLQPEIILSTHARPVVGGEECLRRLNGYMDQITLTFDQTLRGILGGLGPDEIRHEIFYPPHLAEVLENAQVYGESIHFPAAIYQYAIGWFDNDVTRLFSIQPKDEAERLVALIGGRDAVVAAATDALKRNEYAWSAQLIQYVYLLDPQNAEVRQLKADALRAMGHLTTGSIPRAFLLTEARALEGTVEIPRLIPPTPETIAASPEVFVNYFRVRIDPRLSADTDKVLTFNFTGASDGPVGLHVRRGIAEYLTKPSEHYKPVDFALTLSPETWAELYLSSVSMSDAIASGAVTLEVGSATELAEVFGAFDIFDRARNITVPFPDDVTHRGFVAP
jgi:alkyl sulfatase BDS1-like metallo-beta-lactamase superfamily hydrolase